ncbi:MAG: DUF3798 domain-containing protein, partial [Oscillospiraceae bacterium]
IQGTDELAAANKMKEKYGDRVVIATYPASFSENPDITIATVKELASDPNIKALIFVEAISGSSAAIEKAKQINPDLLVIAGLPGEDPDVISPVCDIVLSTKAANGMGKAIPVQAKKMGAKTLIHYSFPRHMSIATLSDCRDVMQETCDKIGIEFVDATSPDPTVASGIDAVKDFIAKDVPKQIEHYGKDTAFYTTNRATQEPLIRAVVENGAIYTQQCAPCPLHDFPTALGVDIPEDKAYDTAFVINAITKKSAEIGMTGRLSTWSVPFILTIIEGSTDYAFKYIDGEITEKVDEKVLNQCLIDAANNSSISITKFNDPNTDVEYQNYFTLMCDYVTF